MKQEEPKAEQEEDEEMKERQEEAEEEAAGAEGAEGVGLSAAADGNPAGALGVLTPITASRLVERIAFFKVLRSLAAQDEADWNLPATKGWELEHDKALVAGFLKHGAGKFDLIKEDHPSLPDRSLCMKRVNRLVKLKEAKKHLR